MSEFMSVHPKINIPSPVIVCHPIMPTETPIPILIVPIKSPNRPSAFLLCSTAPLLLWNINMPVSLALRLVVRYLPFSHTRLPIFIQPIRTIRKTSKNTRFTKARNFKPRSSAQSRNTFCTTMSPFSFSHIPILFSALYFGKGALSILRLFLINMEYAKFSVGKNEEQRTNPPPIPLI